MDVKVAYFSAEIGIEPYIKTYSGGLGILAGDTLKAMADLSVPLCAVTLLYKYGYFKQKIENNTQTEVEDSWDYEKILTDTQKTVTVNINNTPVLVKIWKYEYKGVTGHKIPIYFLDTHLAQNPTWAQDITNHLYVGDRLSQEIVLGIGGVRALDALGYNAIQKYHMNEGHSALLTLELYKKFGFKYGWDDCFVKTHCVFTTHTPIPAGHDQFEYSELYERLQGEPNLIPLHIKKLAGEERLNMTRLAMNFSDYSNAVSRKHGEVTKQMFPEKTVDYITNGIHALSWTHPKLAELYNLYMPKWKEDNAELANVAKIPNSELYKAHNLAKKELIDFVNTKSITGAVLDEQRLTIGFARRFVAYKDAELIFSNLDNLKRIGPKVQFIFAGKAHKKDMLGKEILRRIIEKAKELKGTVSIGFIENYDIEVAKRLVSGCDMWLNTPIPFNEASGTSGMKAAVNGCLHFSRLDGWAIEAFEMNCGGYPISDYKDFITTLEYKVIPEYYAKDKTGWLSEMKLAIGNSGSYFSTHRMVKEYLKKSYKI